MHICPVCGHSNAALAIVCGNPQCRTLLLREDPAAAGKGTIKASSGPPASSWTSDPGPAYPMPGSKPGSMAGSSASSAGGEGDGGPFAGETAGGMAVPPGAPDVADDRSATSASSASASSGDQQPPNETPDREPAPAQPALPGAFAAIKPGARPRPIGRPPGGAGGGGGDDGEDDDDLGGEGAGAPPPESTRAERARFLAVKPGGTRPAPEVRPGVEVPQVGVTLSLSPTEVNVDPGGEASFEVLVRNTGTIVDQFAIQVTGDAARWAYVDPSSVNLYPDSDAAVVALRFSPPHSPFTPAGPARFEVRAVSGENSNISAAGRGVVNVAPFYALSAALVPHSSEGRRYADHRLTVANQGNTRVNTTLIAGDPDSRLRFNLNPSAVAAEPGSEVASEVRVRPRKPHWLGNPVLRPFEVTGTAEGVPPVKAEGQFQHIPLIPKWVPKVAIVVLPLLILLVTYLIKTAPLPNVAGAQLAAAKRTLTDAGFKPAANASEEPSRDVAKGAVIRADSPQKAGFLGRTPKGDVTVVTSQGVAVPAVDQLDEAGATAALRDAGLTVANVQSVANKAEAGIAVATLPPAKSFVDRRSSVTLLLSSGMATAAVNPTSLTMPGQPVGVASQPQAVTIDNQGNGELVIGAVAIGGANAADFDVTSNTCQGAPVAKGANCVVMVTFTPGAAGPRTGALSLSSNGGNSTVTMTGTGLTAEIGLGAANLNFPDQKVGTPSNAQTVTVSNKGSAPMTMGESTVVGGTGKDFTITDGCKGNTVAPGSACSVAVVFTPEAKGARTGRLNVSNAAGGGQSVALSGKGTAPEAILDQMFLVIADKQSQVLTLTNRGDAPLALGTPRIEQASEAFQIKTHDCSSQLAPNAACKITVIRQAPVADNNKCWDGALVVPTDDPVKRDLRVGLTATEQLGKSLNALLPGLNVCGL